VTVGGGQLCHADGFVRALGFEINFVRRENDITLMSCCFMKLLLLILSAGILVK